MYIFCVAAARSKKGLMLKQLFSWRSAGWALSASTCLLGMVGFAYLMWSTRFGHPRGPVGEIFAGFIFYTSLTVRLIGGAGLLLFKPASKPMTYVIAGWAAWMCLLWGLDLPAYTHPDRVVFGIWCVVALAIDLYLFSTLRHGSRHG